MPASLRARVPSARAYRLAGPLGTAAVLAVGCAGVWFADPTTPGGPLPVCPTYALFGVLCPGCGGLRMVYSLLHFDVAAAAHLNVVALLALPLMAWAWGAWLLGSWRGSTVRSWLHARYTLPVVVTVLVTWFVVRNIPIEPFTLLQINK